MGCLLSSCKNTKDAAPVEDETEYAEETEEMDLDDNLNIVNDFTRVPSYNNTEADEIMIMEFIADMYNNNRYTDEAFLKEHCTENMMLQLKQDYEYEGEGLATWDFRSDAQDGAGESRIIKIESIDGRFYYEGIDEGWKFRNILSAFVRDGKVMFDGITRDNTYIPED